MSSILEFSIILLIFVIIAAIVTVSIYLVRLLMDMDVLAKNANETTTILNGELKPLLEELKGSLAKINAIAQSADNQVATLKKLVTTVLGVSSIFVGGFGKMSGGFMKGFQSAFKLFGKK